MNETETERIAKNQQIMASLREAFAPLIQQLTPDVEPATVYKPVTPQAEGEE